MTRQTAKISLLREQLQDAYRTLEGTLEGITVEQAHWQPPGTANPIGANYAHVVLTQDAAINGMLKQTAPLFVGAWTEKTGVSEPHPSPDPDAPGFPDWSAWGERVRVDLPALRQYAQAVFAATDEYLASLSDVDLETTVDLSAIALGQQSLSYFLSAGIIGNALTHCGEISCLKGLQGERGYPI